MAYASGRENGYTIVECILEHFKNDSGYYVNMTLNMEGCLLDFQLPSQDIDHLWDSIYKLYCRNRRFIPDSGLQRVTGV